MLIKRQALISDDMLRANSILHEAPEGFGGSGWRHAQNILAFAKMLKARDILDYGCGENTLRRQLRKDGFTGIIKEYDPAIPKYSALPTPRDIVACTDVLEHVEPELLGNVLDHIHLLTGKGAYLAIACRPANKKLPDGRNAHLIIEQAEWWIEKVTTGIDWTLLFWHTKPHHEVRLWLQK